MAKLTPTEQAAIDAFLAKREPTKLATGATNGMGEKDWQQAVRTPKAEQGKSRYVEEDDDDEGAHERYREAVSDAYMSGGSSARDEVMSMGVHSFRSSKPRVRWNTRRRS